MYGTRFFFSSSSSSLFLLLLLSQLSFLLSLFISLRSLSLLSPAVRLFTSVVENSCCVRNDSRAAYPSSRVIVTAFKPVQLCFVLCCSFYLQLSMTPRFGRLCSTSVRVWLALFSKNSFVLFRVHVHRGSITAAAAAAVMMKMLLSTDCFCCCRC